MLPSSYYEEKCFFLTYYLSTCLSWSFLLRRCCALVWVTKILMRTISNIHVDCIWPAGRRFTTPDLCDHACTVSLKTWALLLCTRNTIRIWKQSCCSHLFSFYTPRNDLQDRPGLFNFYFVSTATVREFITEVQKIFCLSQGTLAKDSNLTSKKTPQGSMSTNYRK